MAADQNNGKQTDIILSDFDCNSASKFSKAWTEDLLSNLKGQFSVINGAITELTLCLKEDIKQIEDSFKLKLNEATISAAEAKASSTMNTIAIQEIRSEMNILKKECLVLKRENEELKKQSNDMETYSRKNNIIFNGIPEVLVETNELCESAVRAF